MRRELAERELKRRLRLNPLQWIQHPNTGAVIPLRWFPAQLAAFDRQERVKVFGMIGANRMGKTLMAAGLTVGAAIGFHPRTWHAQPLDPAEWVLGPARKVWCLTTTLAKSRAVQQAQMWERVPRAWWRNTWRPASGFYNSLGQLTNGSIIAFKSAEQDIRELESESVDWLWIDETVPRHYVRAALMRLIDRGGQCVETTIPDSADLDDFYVRRLPDPMQPHKTLPKDAIDYIGGTMHDNPLLAAAEVELTASLMPAAEREMRIFGRFVIRQGLVYGDFRDELHTEITQLPIPSDWTLVEAIDPGWSNPCAVVFCGIDRHGQYHVYDEIYKRHRTAGEISAMVYLKRWLHRGLMTPAEVARYSDLAGIGEGAAEAPDDLAVQMARDAALEAVVNEWRRMKGDCRPDHELIDEAAKQRDQAKPVSTLRHFEKFGLRPRTCRNADTAGLEMGVRQLLRPMNGIVRFKVDYWRCPMLRYEFGHYREAEIKLDTNLPQHAGDNERRIKKDNHALSCVEYIVDAGLRWKPPEARPAPAGTVLAAMQQEQREERAEKAGGWRRRG